MAVFKISFSVVFLPEWNTYSSVSPYKIMSILNKLPDTVPETATVCLLLLNLHFISELGPQCSLPTGLSLSVSRSSLRNWCFTKTIGWMRTVIICLLPSAESKSRRWISRNIFWAHWNQMYFTVWCVSEFLVLAIKQDKERIEPWDCRARRKKKSPDTRQKQQLLGASRQTFVSLPWNFQ